MALMMAEKPAYCYFLSAATSGRRRQHSNNGETGEYTLSAAETRHENHGPGEHDVRDLGNIGTTKLTFGTVAFPDSGNMPLAIPQAARPQQAA